MRSLVPADGRARGTDLRTHLRAALRVDDVPRPRHHRGRGKSPLDHPARNPSPWRGSHRYRGSARHTSQSRSRDRGRDRQSAPSRVAASSAWGRTAGSVPSAFGAGRIRGHLPGNLAVFGNRHGNRHGSRHGTRHGTRHGALKEDRAECTGRISRAGDPIVIVPRAHTKNAARTACSHHTNVEARPAVPQEMR